MSIIRAPEYHEKTWGLEIWLCNDALYCGKILLVHQDKFCSLHAHLKKTEDFYIRMGRIRFDWCQGIWDSSKKQMEIGGERFSVEMNEGDVVHVPPCMLHRFTGLEPVSEIIEISTQHFEDDSYRVEPSYQPPKFEVTKEEIAAVLDPLLKNPPY